MNIFGYFPSGLHRDLLNTAKPEKPLIFSGVSNPTAKGFLMAQFLEAKKFTNIFWLVNSNKDIYEIKNQISFWSDLPVVALDNLLVEGQDDYRVTEMVVGIHDPTPRIYLLNYSDLSLGLPTYQELMEQGVVLCESIRTEKEKLRSLGFDERLIEEAEAESSILCPV